MIDERAIARQIGARLNAAVAQTAARQAPVTPAMQAAAIASLSGEEIIAALKSGVAARAAADEESVQTRATAAPAATVTTPETSRLFDRAPVGEKLSNGQIAVFEAAVGRKPASVAEFRNHVAAREMERQKNNGKAIIRGSGRVPSLLAPYV
jgi:hypothetical protein